MNVVYARLAARVTRACFGHEAGDAERFEFFSCDFRFGALFERHAAGAAHRQRRLCQGFGGEFGIDDRARVPRHDRDGVVLTELERRIDRCDLQCVAERRQLLRHRFGREPDQEEGFGLENQLRLECTNQVGDLEDDFYLGDGSREGDGTREHPLGRGQGGVDMGFGQCGLHRRRRDDLRGAFHRLQRLQNDSLRRGAVDRRARCRVVGHRAPVDQHHVTGVRVVGDQVPVPLVEDEIEGTAVDRGGERDGFR